MDEAARRLHVQRRGCRRFAVEKAREPRGVSVLSDPVQNGRGRTRRTTVSSTADLDAAGSATRRFREYSWFLSIPPACRIQGTGRVIPEVGT